MLSQLLRTSLGRSASILNISIRGVSKAAGTIHIQPPSSGTPHMLLSGARSFSTTFALKAASRGATAKKATAKKTTSRTTTAGKVSATAKKRVTAAKKKPLTTKKKPVKKVVKAKRKKVVKPKVPRRTCSDYMHKNSTVAFESLINSDSA